MSEPNEPSPSVATRQATDAGRLGDKIAFPDPAAAPLATDAEAAGRQTPPQAATQSLRSQSLSAGTDQTLHFGAEPQPRPRQVSKEMLLAGGVAALVAAGVVAGIISAS